ncbi:MAG: collagen-like protein [Nitrososphaerota archaeon]|jgi:hypothetical protein|nr:collagen-like protein [Nitrososphaerota archaeon]
MNTHKSRNKLLATTTTVLLVATMLLATIPLTTAAITVTGPPSGNVGEIITLTGVVDNPGAIVSIYWNSISTANRLNSTQLTGSSTIYNIDVTIPTAPCGPHALIAVEEIGSTGGSSAGSVALPFSIEPKITLTPNKGVAGDIITVTGTGFAPGSTTNTIGITFAGTAISTMPSTVRADATGSFTATFTVPNSPDGPYTVVAEAAVTGESADAVFTIGPVITLSPNEGPAGIIVTVSGRGFNPDTLAVIVFANTTGTVYTKIVKTDVAVNSAGRFTTTIVIPSAAIGDYTVTVTDNGAPTKSSSEKFHISARTSITVVPAICEPTSTVTVIGRNFARVPGTKVNLMLGAYDYGDFAVDANGSFEVQITIPQIQLAYHTLSAIDTSELSAKTQLGVAAPIAVASPSSNLESGQTITVRGLGFNDLGVSFTANITINGILVASGINPGVLAAGVPVIVPALPVGTAIVKITTNIPDLAAQTTITIAKSTTVIVTPQNALRDTDITIAGLYFTAGTTSVNITIVNVANNNITWLNIPATTNATGGFTTLWHVPILHGTVNVPVGDYTVIVTDANGLTARTSLKIVALDVKVTTGATKYAQGSIGSFQLSSTAQPDGMITIYDSDGDLFNMFLINGNRWIYSTSSGRYTYPSSGFGLLSGTMFQLSHDAKLGSWTWDATFNDAGEDITFSGMFEVISTTVGSQGPKGDTGDTGPKGDTGSQGPKGDTGDRGVTGSSGSSGSTGSTGATGPAGPQGQSGQTGLQGERGPAGPAGSDAQVEDTAVQASAALIIGVIALIIGAVAAFLAITLRQKFAK